MQKWKDCCVRVGVVVLKHAASCLTPDCFPSCQTIESNWRCGRHNLQRIQCRSENSKGVYCLQYDDEKIISGLRDNSIKVNTFFSLFPRDKWVILPWKANCLCFLDSSFLFMGQYLSVQGL